jgi:predicted nucleic acid-binding protein
MILADTSVWVDHLRKADTTLADLLNRGKVLAHPFVTGELALGNLRQRDVILSALQDLPHANAANDLEVLRFVVQHKLFGLGIGYVDAHLLAAVRLTPDALLWTRDKRLLGVAHSFSLHADIPSK